jgi:hypothetical protein
MKKMRLGKTTLGVGGGREGIKENGGEGEFNYNILQALL